MSEEIKNIAELEWNNIETILTHQFKEWLALAKYLYIQGMIRGSKIKVGK